MNTFITLLISRQPGWQIESFTIEVEVLIRKFWVDIISCLKYRATIYLILLKHTDWHRGASLYVHSKWDCYSLPKRNANTGISSDFLFQFWTPYFFVRIKIIYLENRNNNIIPWTKTSFIFKNDYSISQRYSPILPRIRTSATSHIQTANINTNHSLTAVFTPERTMF